MSFKHSPFNSFALIVELQYRDPGLTGLSADAPNPMTIVNSSFGMKVIGTLEIDEI